MTAGGPTALDLTESHRRAFFEAFGYLSVPGALTEDIGWVIDEFESIFGAAQVHHDGTRRSCIVSFVDSSARLSTLLDHPTIESVLESLLGPGANYLGSDGNYYAGDTSWHADGAHGEGTYLKLAIYLDDLRRETGALRVIPGSHRISPDWGAAREAYRSHEIWGIPGHAVPSVALESSPGDLVFFNHNLMHSSWGGGHRRRMFTMNFGARSRTDAELEELKSYILVHMAPHGVKQTACDIMRDTATPARMLHLEQPKQYDDFLRSHVERA